MVISGMLKVEVMIQTMLSDLDQLSFVQVMVLLGTNYKTQINAKSEMEMVLHYKQ